MKRANFLMCHRLVPHVIVETVEGIAYLQKYHRAEIMPCWPVQRGIQGCKDSR